jgi:hypothetical protein
MGWAKHLRPEGAFQKKLRNHGRAREVAQGLEWTRFLEWKKGIPEMKKLLCVWGVIASLAVVQAGVVQAGAINIYEPDAGGGGSWLVTGGSSFTIVDSGSEFIEFTIDIGANAADPGTAKGYYQLVDANGDPDDLVLISATAGSSVVDISVDSYDFEATKEGKKGGKHKGKKIPKDTPSATEHSGLNYVGSIALEDGGQVDVYLQSVPAPSSLVMLLGTAAMWGVYQFARRRSAVSV